MLNMIHLIVCIVNICSLVKINFFRLGLWLGIYKSPCLLCCSLNKVATLGKTAGKGKVGNYVFGWRNLESTWKILGNVGEFEINGDGSLKNITIAMAVIKKYTYSLQGDKMYFLGKKSKLISSLHLLISSAHEG